MFPDLQHQIWLLTLDGHLHKSPLHLQQRAILDLGTGTGAWAMAMARAWPSATVVAADLTPPQNAPGTSNLRFQKLDLEKEWDLEPFKFDFIHGRMLASGIHDWPGLLAKASRHLYPGGRLELLDICHPFRAAIPRFDSADASPFIRFGHLAERTWASNGLDYYATTKHVQRLTDLGFVDINEHATRWPIGEWAVTPREQSIGKLTLQNFMRFLDLAGEALLTHGNSMSKAKAQELLKKARDDLVNHCVEKQLYLTMLVQVTCSVKSWLTSVS